jgi:16S rRNA (guanine527-N7)-methyltransferase
VQEVADALGLENVTAIHGRAEEIKMNGQFDFVLSRGVATMDKLLVWSQRFLKKKHVHVLPNGVLALKGGNLAPEIRELPGKGKEYTEIFPIRNYFREEFFDEKSVVYAQG